MTISTHRSQSTSAIPFCNFSKTKLTPSTVISSHPLVYVCEWEAIVKLFTVQGYSEGAVKCYSTVHLPFTTSGQITVDALPVVLNPGSGWRRGLSWIHSRDFLWSFIVSSQTGYAALLSLFSKWPTHSAQIGLIPDTSLHCAACYWQTLQPTFLSPSDNNRIGIW